MQYPSVQRSLSIFGLFATGLGLLVANGCGGSSGSSMNIPSSVVQDVATLMAEQAGANLAGASLYATRAPRAEPETTACTPSSCLFNEQFDSSMACQYGGMTGFAGDLSGSLNGSASGSIQLQADETFTDCIPVSGYTVNGAPDATVAGTFALVNGVLSFPLQVEEGGAVTINGESCVIDLTGHRVRRQQRHDRHVVRPGRHHQHSRAFVGPK
jgi:hypothetical protein